MFAFVNRFPRVSGLRRDFLTGSELSVSERVGPPTRMIRVPDSELEKRKKKNSNPLTVHAAETVTSLTPRRA